MVTTGASAAVASRLLGRTLQGERAITVDQTNQSVIVADEDLLAENFESIGRMAEFVMLKQQDKVLA